MKRNTAVSLKVIPAGHEKGSIYLDPILVGKDILELVSGAMYVEPLTIFREYIQNAVDAIDEAKEAGLFGSHQPRIDVFVDLVNRSIRIRDTGIGVKSSNFRCQLTAFGSSKKRGTKARGFRGVGRLSGLGYCQVLIFRSRAPEDEDVRALTWDSKKFKAILQDRNYEGDLNQVVQDVTSINTVSITDAPRHFFEVELLHVIRYKNDVLLNEEEIEHYIGQVAPVSFNPDFTFGERISSWLNKFASIQSYPIFLNVYQGTNWKCKQIYRPFSDKFAIHGALVDKVEDVEFCELPGADGNIAAAGWILDHNYLGAIARRESVAGLRLRSGNLQVGSDDIVANLFPESRFNSWCMGEFHVVSPKLLPNGRRDQFESNASYVDLLGHLSAITRDITKACRQKSKIRSLQGRFRNSVSLIEEKVRLIEATPIPPTMEKRLRAEIKQGLRRLQELRDGTRDESLQQKYTKALNRLVGRVERLDASRRKMPLSGIPKARRTVYEKLIGLIYQCSKNKQSASELIGRIISKLEEQQ